jgi:hypothetical protein
MFDRDTWRFINSFAPWLSAVGTLTAVIVSLYLARRAARLDVRVFPAIVSVGVPGQQPWVEYFQNRAVNYGGRPAVISGIGLWLRGMPRQNWLWLPPDNRLSAKIPARLDFGEEAQFLYPTATFNRDAKSVLERVRKSIFPKLTVRLLRIGVFTTTGQRFRVPLDIHLRKFILERSRQLAESPDT